ncbi:MAG: CheR family methyltransferase [Mariprofundaceae bacterium]
MQDSHFHYISDFLLRHSGLALGKEKMYLVKSRLHSLLRPHAMESLAHLIDHVKKDEKGELAGKVVDAMTTNETLFFRDQYPYDALKTFILPEMMQDIGMAGKIRIWSAASSRGQEPYSIAITATGAIPMAEKHIQITATDLSDKALAYAKEGLYSQMEVQRGMPIKQLVRFFTQEKTSWRVRPEIRNMVTFRSANLISSGLLSQVRSGGPFNIVFCRNVMIYFTPEERRLVIDRIASSMKKGGYLITGATEPAEGKLSKWEVVRFESRNIWRLIHA